GNFVGDHSSILTQAPEMWPASKMNPIGEEAGVQLLLLTASRLDETSHPLPSLELLAHEVHVVPLSSALTAVAAHEANARSTIDAILIDGTESPLSARSAAHALNDRVAAP